MTSEWLQISEGQEPIVATAVHDGHELRPDVASIVALSGSDRLREEDPFTATWTTIVGTRVVPTRSRFEVDVNRPRQKAVYMEPEDAWGLRVWKSEPSQEVVGESLSQYDFFYSEMHRVLTDMEERYGSFAVLDLHSYNHRRGGPNFSPDDPSGNPEVNLGTGTVNRERWGGLVDRSRPISPVSISSAGSSMCGKTSGSGEAICRDGSMKTSRFPAAAWPSSSRSSSWTSGRENQLRRSWRRSLRPWRRRSLD